MMVLLVGTVPDAGAVSTVQEKEADLRAPGLNLAAMCPQGKWERTEDNKLSVKPNQTCGVPTRNPVKVMVSELMC